MLNKKSMIIFLTAILVGSFTVGVMAGELSVNTGVDMYNRYVWRGLDIANTPSVQPCLSVSSSCGFELGAWGAYTLSNEASDSDEIDFYLSYTRELNSGVAFSFLATDYYFPNAGIDFFNFNNHDDTADNGDPDPGAHTIELGLSISGPEAFPMTFSAFFNVYNDAGNNAYFQLDYPANVGETALDVFCGFTAGSEDNPGYYGTDEFDLINVGVSADRDITVTDQFSLPLSVALIVNPNAEISYLLAGVSF